jgi:hypothetical protein
MQQVIEQKVPIFLLPHEEWVQVELKSDEALRAHYDQQYQKVLYMVRVFDSIYPDRDAVSASIMKRLNLERAQARVNSEREQNPQVHKIQDRRLTLLAKSRTGEAAAVAFKRAGYTIMDLLHVIESTTWAGNDKNDRIKTALKADAVWQSVRIASRDERRIIIPAVELYPLLEHYRVINLRDVKDAERKHLVMLACNFCRGMEEDERPTAAPPVYTVTSYEALGMGYGLACAKQILEANTFVCHYGGLIMSDDPNHAYADDAELLEDVGRASSYTLSLDDVGGGDQEWILDGARFWKLSQPGRFVNQAATPAEVNCEYRTLISDPEGPCADYPSLWTVGIFTTRRVRAGEQLLINYGTKYPYMFLPPGFVQWNDPIAFIEGSTKRPAEVMSEEDFLQFVRQDQVELIGHLIDSVPASYLQTHYATSPEMCRLLVKHGGDVYAYVENGKVALDYLVQHMNVREFMYEASFAKPRWLNKMIEAAEKRLAKYPDEMSVYADVSDLFGTFGIDTLRLLIYHGFMPVTNSTLLLVVIDHLMFRRYNMETLEFWHNGIEHILSQLHNAKYEFFTVEGLVQNATRTASSFGLNLFAPEQMYKQTRRPINYMGMFQTAESPILRTVPDNQLFIPVTRYANDMSGSLYFKDKKPDEDFCGTFYYYEPESTTYLYSNSVLRAKNKREAVRTLWEKLVTEGKSSSKGSVRDLLQANYNQLMYALEDSNLMFTPTQFIELGKTWSSAIDIDIYKFPIDPNIQDRQFYCAFTLGFYAAEDDFDQALCELGREAGYSAIILEKMVGSRQIVIEVLDTRPREESFRNLHFYKPM